jgi:hypothetical protein
MSAVGHFSLLLVISLIGPVAADAGDDFSNNLFSDLAPWVFLFTLIQLVLMFRCHQAAGTLWRASHHAVHEPVDGLG